MVGVDSLHDFYCPRVHVSGLLIRSHMWYSRSGWVWRSIRSRKLIVILNQVLTYTETNQSLSPSPSAAIRLPPGLLSSPPQLLLVAVHVPFFLPPVLSATHSSFGQGCSHDLSLNSSA